MRALRRNLHHPPANPSLCRWESVHSADVHHAIEKIEYGTEDNECKRQVVVGFKAMTQAIHPENRFRQVKVFGMERVMQFAIVT